MFWGIVLKANKKYSQKTTKSFHVSQAVLDPTSNSGGSNQVYLSYENNKYLICVLENEKCQQVPLDLNFATGEEISFQSYGNGCVHLSGYLTDIPEDFGSSDEEAEDNEIADEEEDEVESDSDNCLMSENAADETEESEDEASSDEAVQQPKAKHMKLDKQQNGVSENASATKKDKKNKKDKKQANASKQLNSSAEKVLPGGLKVQDIITGTGAEVKSGKKVQVYYEGRLKQNNKVFDSCKQGSGFKFNVGRGDVIKGWDIGVVGMKVGGKRRIICPPHMAYGARGMPPQIPPNSTLVFEVEVKGV